MKKKALHKDFIMELKKSLNRFFSIFLIVALGVAFFAGIRATEPDMRITADSYYDQSNLMDIRVLSTLGMTDEDIVAISQVAGVNEVEPAYSTDVLCSVDGNEFVLKVMSATTRLNQYTVLEGRMPEKENECLVDQRFIESSGHKIGDQITLSSGTQEPLSNTLKEDYYTIVGTGNSSYYLSFQRGSSSIGNGEINSFIVVLPEVFAMEVYSQVYVAVEGAKELMAYTDEYDALVEDVAANIEDITKERSKLRYDELYSEAYKKIDEAKKELETAKEQANQRMTAELANIQRMPPGYIGLEKIMNDFDQAKAEAEKEFSDADAKIAASEVEINSIKPPTWYVLDRNTLEAYVEYGQNADRIGAIGEVFPALFFLVAALISLTTMTRMVEEERTQIGTLKALGYSKKSIAMKYILYALLATLGGSIFGFLIGEQVFPRVIITAYKIMYPIIPEVLSPFNAYYAMLSTVVAILCVGIATVFACYKELLAKPAELMRPIAPKNGKRVMLERIPFLWNRLTFTWKATIRNLIRYKKRFFMTIFGIGGCMSLLLVGFGLKDSIFVIYTRQFDEIQLYEGAVSIENDATPEEIGKIEDYFKQQEEIDSSLQVRESTVEIGFQGSKKSITLFIPSSIEDIADYVTLRSRIMHTPYNLADDGVILTEQVANNLGIKVGDTITIEEGDAGKVEVTVSAISENYMQHYVYMTPEYYKTHFGKTAKNNEYLLLIPSPDKEQEHEIGAGILKLPGVTNIFYVSKLRNQIDNMLGSLNIVIYVLIISAGALAFVVLYNLNNININERRRELATIKVLGFYDYELAEYVYRENIMLTLIGALAGTVMGSILHRFVIVTVEIDMVMFGRNIDLSSYIFSILLTCLFSAFVNFVMYFKLKKIDMVESLKSVE